MQQAIERVECGNEEEKQNNSKSNPRYDDPSGTPIFLWNRCTPTRNPRLLSLFPLEINFDAPPFRMLGDLIHSCHDSVRSLRFLYAMKPEIC